MTPKGHRVIRGRHDILYDQKGHGDLGGAYFMAIRSRVKRGRRNLLYDYKGHGDLCGRFDIDYDPKK